MFENTIFLILIIVGLSLSFLGSATQAKPHHHRNIAKKKETDIVQQNADQFKDFPELLAELSGDLNDSAMKENQESGIEKRHVSNVDLASISCENESKERLIDIYAGAAILHSDKRDRALIKDMLKTARQWHWSSFEDFKKYADKIFLEVKERHENDVN